MGCGCGFLCGEHEEEEEAQFFDTKEDLSSASGSSPGSPMNKSLSPGDDFINSGSYDKLYGDWITKPDSIQERRNKFRKWMGLPSSSSPEHNSADFGAKITRDGELTAHMERITADSGAALMCSHSESLISSSPSENSGALEHNDPKNRLFDTISMTNGFRKHDAVRKSSEVCSSLAMATEEPKRTLAQSPFQKLFRRKATKLAMLTGSEDNVVRRGGLGWAGWLRKMRIADCIVGRQEEDTNTPSSVIDGSTTRNMQRVKVHSYRKKSKEFSAVYMGQDIKAHEGAIWTMKFSLDGQYLASGGEDGIGRIWHVNECELEDEEELSDNLELHPLPVNNDKKRKPVVKKKMLDTEYVVVPPQVFRIAEKPFHEFIGHTGAVLDLSWSEDKRLLSSSVDKTVRLWKVGFGDCIKVFSHKDYVTSVHFDPIEENQFISGSLDGKIRIWDISGCHVVDWTDIKDIVTAVCYRPDGKAVVAGSMSGVCRFYGLSDNHLQLDNQISLPGKKKFPLKRITGFQFSPTDAERLMVTSADSQILVLSGFEVISKYKGLQNAGGIISASFSSDGRYITSASEDSSIYVWNHNNQNAFVSNKVKSTWSSERFSSRNASVAIPWNRVGSRNYVSLSSKIFSSQLADFKHQTRNAEACLRCISDLICSRTIFLLASGHLTLSQGFFSDFLSRGSATWPEEKLPLYVVSSSRQPVSGKAKHRLMENSDQNSAAYPNAWGEVIVTAGLDGRIRSFCNYGLPVQV